jgi:pimeloyl-ACP methyl ester carboxylesterase
MAWYWHRVGPHLERAGYEAIAVDLPGDDESAGLDEYAEIIIQAIGQRSNVVLVAQSLGAFTAPLICDRASVSKLVFVNAMIPRPGETAGDWWANTGAVEARIAAAKAGGYSPEFDVPTYFLHDVPQEVLRNGPSHQREQTATIFAQPCRFERWPPIPIRVIAARDDRFFPIELQRRVAQDRLHAPVEVISGGHLVALSRPEEPRESADTVPARVIAEFRKAVQSPANGGSARAGPSASRFRKVASPAADTLTHSGSGALSAS